MKMSALIEFLDLLSENGIYAFTNGMIRNIFPGEPEENLKKTLSRAVSGRVIERVCRGYIRAPTPSTPTSLNPSRPRFAAESTLTSVLRHLFQNTA